MSGPTEQHDIVIVGGGLAGLTLALQINQSSPGLAVTVLEKNRFPMPAAAHKVGEATVEIGAHYLAHTLGLEDLLERTQMRKFGLRLFFGGEARHDLAGADELGASRLLPVISYQLDRGNLENSLADLCVARGVALRSASRVKKITAGSRGDRHELLIRDDKAEYKLGCRWLVDASGRAALLKRSLNKAKASKHRMCASWFRVDAPISVDDWSGCADWKSRCNGLSRRPSTNHLMGSGYWCWVIPLAGGRSSIGVVMDPEIHDLGSINSLERLRGWLRERQPMLADAVDATAEGIMDFHCRRNLATDSQQLWSADGWAMSGEAGLFADPFYSPGTDFIGLNNTFICDLVTSPRSATELATRAAIYQKVCQSFFDSTMSLYEGLYGGFGDTRLMVLKSTWDYAYYWSILAWMFFAGLMTDIAFFRRAQPELLKIRALNSRMQAAFRQQADARHVDDGAGRFFDQAAIPLLLELNTALPAPSDDPMVTLRRNCERLESVAPRLLTLFDGHTMGTRRCSLLGELPLQLSA